MLTGTVLNARHKHIRMHYMFLLELIAYCLLIKKMFLNTTRGPKGPWVAQLKGERSQLSHLQRTINAVYQISRL